MTTGKKFYWGKLEFHPLTIVMNNSLTHKAIEEINFSKLFGYDFWIKSKGWHTIRSNYFLSNEKSHHCNVYRTSHDLYVTQTLVYINEFSGSTIDIIQVWKSFYVQKLIHQLEPKLQGLKKLSPIF